MNAVFITMLQYMTAYLGLCALMYFVLNFLTKGFLGTFLLVKMSQGRLTMTRIHAVADTYYKKGQWIEGFYSFKDRHKETKKIPITEAKFKSYYSTEMGVNFIDIDEQGNKLFNTDYKAVDNYKTFDAGATESLFMRIKNRPQLEDKKIIMMIILLILILLIVGFCAYDITKILTALEKVLQMGGNV